MKQGHVILTPVPQADGKLKERPAIVLREMPLYGDFLVCGISTQVKVDEHGEYEEEGEYATFVPSTLPMYLMIVGRKEASNKTDAGDA